MRSTQRTLAIALLLGASQTLLAQPGALDPSFNTTGYVVQPVNTGDGVQKILVQADQKILSIGMSWDATFTARAYVFRYLPDGTPDTDFATNGVFTYELDNEALLYSGMITAAGKILLVGATTDYETYRMLLIQLNEDGTPDDSFGTNGVVVQSVGQAPTFNEDFAYNVAQDASGNILVCGNSHGADYVRRPVVVRFTSTGALDTDFGVDGVATIPVMQVGASAFKCVRVQPDGKILASGYFGETELWYTLLLARFHADGTLDDTFSGDGVVRHSYGNVDDLAQEFVLTPDGSILTAGKTVTVNYNYSALLMKFTPAGELDASFGNAGAVKEDLDDFDYGWNLALQNDGRIIMAGTSGDGPPNGFDLAVWKYLPDGTRDNGFGSNGLVQHVIPTYYTMIYGMAMQADGRILIGGQARTTINENYFFTARLENGIFSGITEAGASAAIIAMPNPATPGSFIALRSEQPILPDASVALTTADGRLVQSYPKNVLRRGTNGIGLQLPDDLSAGAYRITLQQAGTRFTTAILLTH